MRNKPSAKKDKNHIYTSCHICHQTFLDKYWDDELDWYIQLNQHHNCSVIHPEKQSPKKSQSR